MKLIVTIDTEEDNWARYSTTNNPVENIERIVPLQDLFDDFGVRPTYLISYPVATNPRSVVILRRILEEGKCEIGAHCHPWNTPPFEEEINDFNSMLCNLPEPLVHRKLSVLHEAICKNFGVVPISFRAGRWGFGPVVAASLCRLGYRIDSSVSPFENLMDYSGPDFSDFGPEIFRFTPRGLANKDESGVLLEVPASVGFLQANFQMCQKVLMALRMGSGHKLHISGILARMRLLNKVWLTPELAGAEDMIKLARRLKKLDYPCLNMTFHSTNLVKGLSPFVRTSEEEQGFTNRIRMFLSFTVTAGWEALTLAEFEDTIGRCPSEKERVVRYLEEGA